MRIPGLQSGASDGDVLTFASGTGLITLQAAGGGGSSYPFLIDTTSLYSGFVPGSLSGNPQDNTVLGISAGNLLVDGSGNTLIGSNAGRNIVSKNFTTIVGDEAAYSGGNDYSTYVGHTAGRGATGNFSVHLGSFSARSSSANEHVSVGAWAGGLQTSGLNNTNVGYKAGYSATTASNNVIPVSYTHLTLPTTPYV